MQRKLQMAQRAHFDQIGLTLGIKSGRKKEICGRVPAKMLLYNELFEILPVWQD
jgi:hypothetical protein